MNNPQPIQPLVIDDHGSLRFRKNAIVSDILDAAGKGEVVDMNLIASREYSRADRVQFAQLIGYSLSGFSELSYVSNDDYDIAIALHDDAELKQVIAERDYYREQINQIRKAFQEPIANLYQVHPDNLDSDSSLWERHS